jgi:Holliday junction resolvase
MTPFTQRLAAGQAHEHRVRRELEQRGWEVTPWGQGILPEATRRALTATGTGFRHFPDLIAARAGQAAVIDAKDRARTTRTSRYAVARSCVSFGLQFTAAFALPLYYVFGNLDVLTPAEVMAYGTATPQHGTGAYYLTPQHTARRLDDIFGHPRPENG